MAVEYFFDILSYFTIATLVFAVFWDVFRYFPNKKADIWVVVMLSYFASEAAKFFFNRPRPEFTDVFRGVGSSFPSTHTTVAFAVFFYYLLSCHNMSRKKRRGVEVMENQPGWFSQRVPMLGFTFVLAAMTGILRYLAGLHYMSDVFAGIILGFIISWVLIHYDISLKRIK